MATTYTCLQALDSDLLPVCCLIAATAGVLRSLEQFSGLNPSYPSWKYENDDLIVLKLAGAGQIAK